MAAARPVTRITRRLATPRADHMWLLRAAVIAAAMTSCAATAQGMPAAEPVARPPFAPNAQEDEWVFLADPARRTEALDRLKHIALNGSGTSYAYVGGQFRIIARVYEDEDFGTRPGIDDTYHRRVMLHGGVVVDDRLRLFAEVKYGGVESAGSPLGPVEAGGPDLHQAFVEGRFGPLREHRVRVGRQELHYGRGLLVSVREGPNIRASHDGGLFRAQFGTWRIDAFVVQPVVSSVGVFDDRREPGALLSGFYVAGQLTDGAAIDVYYFGDRRRGRRYANASGDEMRHTLGARFEWRQPTWSVDAEAAVQVGELTDPVTGIVRPIRAWTLYARLERLFAGASTPVLAVEAGIASGDRVGTDTALNSFRAPQPPGRYFGNTTLLGPTNIAGITPSVSCAIAPRTRLTLQSRLFWRVSSTDGVYSPPGFLLRRGDLSRARFIGGEIGANITHQFDRHSTFSVAANRFQAGNFLRGTPPGRNVNLGEIIMAFRF